MNGVLRFLKNFTYCGVRKGTGLGNVYVVKNIFFGLIRKESFRYRLHLASISLSCTSPDEREARAAVKVLAWCQGLGQISFSALFTSRDKAEILAITIGANA